MKWNLLTDPSAQIKSSEELVTALLKNRGLITENTKNEFLTPTNPHSITLRDIGIAKLPLGKALKRVRGAIKVSEPIVVYGDYDADGICATTILYESLRDLGATVMPFIPLREKEGYGLSKEGIDTIVAEEKYKFTTGKGANGLLIVVDSGIVANEAISYANKLGFDVLVLDHHEKGKKVPKALAIVHTKELCAAGISFFFVKELLGVDHPRVRQYLELAAIATITDLMPLLGVNRSIVKWGLELLNKTERLGLRALLSVAGIERVGTYEVGYLIGPRLNASGRIESALTALRMLCTSDFNKALEYARQLNDTNKQRQGMTEEMTFHAFSELAEGEIYTRKIIVIDHESYHQGVIGLIAGKLVERYYLPAIVIARGEGVSKASARSVTGFNIIEAINKAGDLLLGAGGHPMAAGFTIETEKIILFKEKIAAIAQVGITPEMLERSLRIDTLLPLTLVTRDLWQKLQSFAPFGTNNPEPTFGGEARIEEIRTVGQDGKHLKLKASDPSGKIVFDGIAFNKGEMVTKLGVGDLIKIAYTIDNNIFNHREALQLKIKDIITVG